MAKNSIELVHHKDLHKVHLQGLRVKERSIFMTLCYKAMQQESNLIVFDISELKKIIQYRSKKEDGDVYEYLNNTYTSLQNITIKIDKNNGIKRFVLFTMFETFKDKGIVHFKINDEYRYLLNDVVAPYTIQNLLEYNNLSSKYSQLLYSVLRQWEKNKKIKFTMTEFREKFSVPENYRISEIDKFIFSLIQKELSPIFQNLNIKKIKTGRIISHIEFSWGEKKKILQKQKAVIEPQQLSLLQVPKIETVETPRMDLVRQCIADHPDACPGHDDEALNGLCANARKFKK